MNNIRTTFYTSLSKRLLIALLSIGVAGHLTGCAMGGSSDETTADGGETFAEESSGDFAEGDEPVDGEEVAEGDEAPADGEEGTEVAEGDAAAEGDDMAAEVEGTEVAEGDDMSLDGDAGSGDVAAMDDDELSLDDEEGLPSDIASNDLGAEPAPIIDEPAAAPTDAPVFADNATDVPSDSVSSADSAPSEPTAWVPVKKVKSASFMAGDTNLNRVYLARAGDTRPGISQKIYGDKTHSKDLLKWNGFLARGVKTGDKIYYASPTNPTDTNMLTYYEDVGVPAQNYVSRDGDNIREVSKTLLGDKDSWKEVWATNPDVESKGDIAAGLNIRYWPDGSAPAAPVMAQNPADIPPADPMMGQDPLAQQGMPPVAGNDPLAQPPADVLAPNDPVGMPPQDPGGMAMNDPLAQPTGTPASVPPAVGTTEPPPPPPPADPPADTRTAGTDPAMGHGTEEADNMMMMGLAGIVLLAAGAVFFLMRRSRSRKVDLTQTTQVG